MIADWINFLLASLWFESVVDVLLLMRLRQGSGCGSMMRSACASTSMDGKAGVLLSKDRVEQGRGAIVSWRCASVASEEQSLLTFPALLATTRCWDQGRRRHHPLLSHNSRRAPCFLAHHHQRLVIIIIRRKEEEQDQRVCWSSQKSLIQFDMSWWWPVWKCGCQGLVSSHQEDREDINSK